METLNVWGILSRGLHNIANRFYNGAQDNLAVFMPDNGPNNDQVIVDDQNSTDRNIEKDNCDSEIDDNEDDVSFTQVSERNAKITDEKHIQKRYSLRSKISETSKVSNKDEKTIEECESNKVGITETEDEKFCAEDDKMSKSDDSSNEDEEMSSKDDSGSDPDHSDAEDLSDGEDHSDAEDHSDVKDKNINGKDDHCNGVDNHDLKEQHEEEEDCIENGKCTVKEEPMDNNLEMENLMANDIDLTELCRGIVVPVRKVQEEINDMAVIDSEIESDSDTEDGLPSDNVVRRMCNVIKEYGDVSLKGECKQNQKDSTAHSTGDSQCSSSKDIDDDSKSLHENDQLIEQCIKEDKIVKLNNTDDDPIASITLNFKKKLQKLQEDALHKSLSKLKSESRKVKSGEITQEEVKTNEQQEETGLNDKVVDYMNLSVCDSGEFSKYIEITDVLNNSRGEVVKMNTPRKAKVFVDTEDKLSSNVSDSNLEEEKSPGESEVCVLDEMADKEVNEKDITTNEAHNECPGDSNSTKADVVDTNDAGSNASGKSVDFSVHPPENILKSSYHDRNSDSDEDSEFIVSRKRIRKAPSVVYQVVETKKFECDECGKVFQRKANLTVHLNKYHPLYSDDDDDFEDQYHCKFCTRSFKKLGHLDMHIRAKHT